jgi:peroxiredoxin Q/BCP
LSARKVDYEKFRAAGVQILGISTDNVFSQKAFADSLKLPFPLLSDRAMTVTRAYGVVYGRTAGKNDYPSMNDLISKRAFFLVDADGVVRGKWIGEDMSVFPTDVLLKVAREHAPKR